MLLADLESTVLAASPQSWLPPVAKPAAANCSNKRAIWRLQTRLFTPGQARTTLNEVRSTTLQARGSGFESPWLHYVMSRDTVSRCLETSLHFWGCPTSRLVMVAPSSLVSRPGPAAGLRPALTPAAGGTFGPGS